MLLHKRLLLVASVVVLVFVSLGLTAATTNGPNDGLKFRAALSGDQENPAVSTTMTGEVAAKFDDALTQVEVVLRVKSVPESVTVEKAHFHCGRPGLNAPIAFGLFVPGPLSFDDKKGVARGMLTNADFIGTDCVPHVGRPVNNIAALAFAMRDGLVYANVHTDTNPGGEIRGQLIER